MLLTALLAVAVLAQPPAASSIDIDPRTTPVVEGKTSGTYKIVYTGPADTTTRYKNLSPDVDGQLRHKAAAVGDWVHIWTKPYFDEWVLVLSVLSDATVVTQRANYYQEKWPSYVKWELVKGDPPGTIRSPNGAWVWPSPTVTFRNCQGIVVEAQIKDVPGVAVKLEGCSDVVVQDSTFDNWASQRNGLFGGLVFETSTHVTVRRCTFKNSDGIAIMPRTGKDVSVQDSVFKDVCRTLGDTAAIHAEGRLWAYDDLEVKDCSFDGVGTGFQTGGDSFDLTACVYPDDGRQKTRVERCTFARARYGVFVHGGSTVTVHRCYFAPSVKWSVRIAAAPKTWVESWNADPRNDGYKDVPLVPRGINLYLNRDLSTDKALLDLGVSATITPLPN